MNNGKGKPDPTQTVCRHKHRFREVAEVSVSNGTARVETCSNCGAIRDLDSGKAEWDSSFMKKCEICQEPFLRRNSEYRNVCSEECRRERRRLKVRERGRRFRENRERLRESGLGDTKELPEPKPPKPPGPPPNQLAAIGCPRCGNSGMMITQDREVKCIMCSRTVIQPTEVQPAVSQEQPGIHTGTSNR